ncbi:MAG TPA: hypothetical protein VFK47_22695 [Ktedonobacteraceae bacterium]|nr:hypothetical protein [Ktedonobacteraceae bacterium]
MNPDKYSTCDSSNDFEMATTTNNKRTILAATTLPAILAVAAISPMATPAYAASDPRGDVTTGNPDFDINNFGVNSQDGPYLTVYGDAGGTVPGQVGIIYAYIFFTDDGIYAVTSHVLEDSTETGNDIQWHAHKITLLDNRCITSVLEDGWAVVEGKPVTVAGTNASSISSVMTAEVTGNCITEVFDRA